MRPTAPCPCGSDEPFGRCCLPLHLGERQAETAEQLMRARYSAYAVDTLDYVWQTWHPRTRPKEMTAQAGSAWTGLEIVDTVEGLSGDESGEVEFRAHYVQNRRNAGRCMSGPASPLEPVGGFTWTGSCSGDPDQASRVAGSVKGRSRSVATCSESSEPSCVDRPLASAGSASQAACQPLSASFSTYGIVALVSA